MKKRLTVSSYVTNFAEEEYERSIFFWQKGVFKGRGWISGSPLGAKRCLVPNPNWAETSTHQPPKFNC